MKHELHDAGIAIGRTDRPSAEERQTVIRLLKEAALRGRGIGEVPAAGLARLEVEEFAWPEFDRWRAFFAQREKFPPLWDEVKRIPNLRREVPATLGRS